MNLRIGLGLGLATLAFAGAIGIQWRKSAVAQDTLRQMIQRSDSDVLDSSDRVMMQLAASYPLDGSAAHMVRMVMENHASRSQDETERFIEAMEEKCHDVVQKIFEARDRHDFQTASTLKELLNRLSSDIFDQKEALRRNQIERLEKRLEELKSFAQLREEKKNEIVERRVLQLLGHPDPMDWDAQSPSEDNNGNDENSSEDGGEQPLSMQLDSDVMIELATEDSHHEIILDGAMDGDVAEINLEVAEIEIAEAVDDAMDEVGDVVVEIEALEMDIEHAEDAMDDGDDKDDENSDDAEEAAPPTDQLSQTSLWLFWHDTMPRDVSIDDEFHFNGTELVKSDAVADVEISFSTTDSMEALQGIRIGPGNHVLEATWIVDGKLVRNRFSFGLLDGQSLAIALLPDEVSELERIDRTSEPANEADDNDSDDSVVQILELQTDI